MLANGERGWDLERKISTDRTIYSNIKVHAKIVINYILTNYSTTNSRPASMEYYIKVLLVQACVTGNYCLKVNLV